MMNFEQRRRFLWVLLLIGLALITTVAKSTTYARLPFKELAQQSTAIARLRCLSSESKWQNGEIWTETRFEVIESNKGSLPGMVSVQMMGGVVGQLHSRVDGVPVFRAGEEVYLFLWGAPDGGYRVLGWQQGTFRIHRGGQDGAERVTQDSAAAPVFNLRTREFHRVRNLPIAIFRLKLRKALRQQPY
jgi:hypothetical protein